MMALHARLVPIVTLIAVTIGTYATYRLDLWTIDGPGPGLLPKIALAITALTALPLSFFPGAPTSDQESEEAAEPPRTFLVYALSCAAMALAVPWLGFILPGLLCVLAILRFAENRSWLISLGYSTALVFGLVLFFGMLLDVQFPDGPVERILQSIRLL